MLLAIVITYYVAGLPCLFIARYHARAAGAGIRFISFWLGPLVDFLLSILCEKYDAKRMTCH